MLRKDHLEGQLETALAESLCPIPNLSYRLHPFDIHPTPHIQMATEDSWPSPVRLRKCPVDAADGGGERGEVSQAEHGKDTLHYFFIISLSDWLMSSE